MPASGWLVDVFRISLCRYYQQYLKGEGFFLLYSDSTVNLATIDPDSAPRLIVCPLSVGSIRFLENPSKGRRRWKSCFDKICQTRAITCASDLLDDHKMARVDTALQNAVQAAQPPLTLYQMQ